MRTRALLAALSLLLLAAPVSAASSIAVNESAPALGTVVTFTVSGIPTNVKNPRVKVTTIQSTCPVGSTCIASGSDFITYQETGSLGQATCDGTDSLGYCGFFLGGAWSPWLVQGGSAHIVATLFYYGKDHGEQIFVPLATTSFEAAA